MGGDPNYKFFASLLLIVFLKEKSRKLTAHKHTKIGCFAVLFAFFLGTFFQVSALWFSSVEFGTTPSSRIPEAN